MTARTGWKCGATVAAWAVALSTCVALAQSPSPGGAAAPEVERPRGESPKAWSGLEGIPAQARAEKLAVLSSLRKPAEPVHCVVRMKRVAGALFKRDCTAAGLELQTPLGSGAYLALLGPGANAAELASFDAIEQVFALPPEQKVDAAITQDLPAEWAAFPPDADGEPRMAAYLLFHRDVDLDLKGYALVQQRGIEIVDELRTLNGLVILASASDVRALSAEEGVLFIERAIPQLTEANAQNRALTGAEAAQQPPYALSGEGIRVMVYDGGRVRTTHVDFGGRATVRDDGISISSHATHVAGTIAGAGTASGGLHRGMAPGAWIESYSARFSGTGVVFFTNPGDIEADYTHAVNLVGADIANNSVGSNVSINNYDCALMGDYGVTAALIDGIVRGSLGTPFRIVFAAGNERQSTRCSTDGWRSIAPPAGAKNHITVGNVYSDSDTISSSSSWGPTDDGRLKPDLVAPGCQQGGDGGVTSTSGTSDNAYIALCGTSMAAPTFTGCAALLLQDYRALYPGPDPRNSTLKAIFTQTAADLGNTGPDYQYGYGSIRVLRAVDLLRDGRFVEAAIGHDDVYSFELDLPAGLPELRATLAWDDPPAAPLATQTLVNDLDLQFIDPDGNVHWPWTLDPSQPGLPAVQLGPDRVNNLEQVFVASPMAGRWRLEVRGFNVPDGPQLFSVATNAAMVPSPRVEISFPDGLPDQLAPGVPRELHVRVKATADALAGSPELWFQYADGPQEGVQLAPTGQDDTYVAILPAPVCSARPRFFVRARGVSSGGVTSPSNAPAAQHELFVGSDENLYADDFERPGGWTAQNGVGLTDGAWEAGIPVGDGDRGDPAAAFGGSGQCYLTANRRGNSDVDGGSTSLISPVIPIASGDAVVRYALWFTNHYGDNPGDDYLNVYASADGGATWTLANVHGPDTMAGWDEHEFRIDDVLGQIPSLRLRFDVSDTGGASIVEAAVDHVRVVRFNCDQSLSDCNRNGILDSADIADGRSDDVNHNGRPDECELALLPGDMNCDGTVTTADVPGFVYALTDLARYAAAYPGCDPLHADVNLDGAVTISDIPSMVALLAP